jgi:uncharacterized protein YjiS (DUF1127 family)
MSAIHLQPLAGLTGGLRRHAPAHDGLRQAGRRLRATLHEWRRRSRERAELAELDDRALLDIGLSRADAEFLANRPFWKE